MIVDLLGALVKDDERRLDPDQAAVCRYVSIREQMPVIGSNQ